MAFSLRRTMMLLLSIACLSGLPEAVIARNGSFSETETNGRVTSLKLTIHKDTGQNSATTIFITCARNKTRLRVQFTRDYQRSDQLNYAFPRKAAQSFSFARVEGRAVYVNRPIRFIQDWLNEISVTLAPDSSVFTGTSEFSLKAFDVEGIYKIAKACNWDHLIGSEAEALDRARAKSIEGTGETAVEPSS